MRACNLPHARSGLLLRVPKATYDPAETYIDFVDSDEYGIEFKTPKLTQGPGRSRKSAPPPASTEMPKAAEMPESVAEERIETALVSPAKFEVVAEKDISLAPRRGKLLIGLGSLAVAGVAAALILGGSVDTKSNASLGEPVTKPALGSLTVVAASEAKVWLFLGKTPIDSLANHSEATRIIRVEHEGYHSQVQKLLPSTWRRDQSGARYAEATFSLLPAERAAPAQALDGEAFSEGRKSTAGRPANLRIRSTPTAASAWLYVGSTPSLRISDLPTNGVVELRVTRGEEPPIYRVLKPDQFDASGEAHLELQLPALTIPADAPALPRPSVSRPSSESDPNNASSVHLRSRAKARRQKARRPAKNSRAQVSKPKELGHPTPDWAK